MYFFLFYSSHPQYVENEVHYLSNFEAEKLIKSTFYAANDFKYKSANNLAELVFFAAKKDSFYFCPIEDFLESCLATLNKLCKDFGIETIKKSFPNQRFDGKLRDELENKFDIYTEAISKAWEEADQEDFLINEDKKFDKMLDELNREIDNDDEGEWRISNDIG